MICVDSPTPAEQEAHSRFRPQSDDGGSASVNGALQFPHDSMAMCGLCEIARRAAPSQHDRTALVVVVGSSTCTACTDCIDCICISRLSLMTADEKRKASQRRVCFCIFSVYCFVLVCPPPMRLCLRRIDCAWGFYVTGTLAMVDSKTQTKYIQIFSMKSNTLTAGLWRFPFLILLTVVTHLMATNSCMWKVSGQ